MRVVNLGEVRDLLQSWEEVRQHIIQGEVKAFALTLKDAQSHEAVYFGGQYKADPGSGLQASLRQSWAMTQALPSGRAERS